VTGTLRVTAEVDTAQIDKLWGGNDEGDMNRVVIGSGLSISNDTLTASVTNDPARWDGGPGYAATVRIALTTTLDTVNFNNSAGIALTFYPHLSNLIEFDTVPGSNFRGWMFDEAGVYEFTYNFHGKGTNNTTNKRTEFHWYKNGEPIDPTDNMAVRLHYIETTTYLGESASYHVEIADGDYIQLLAKNNSSTSDYDMRGFSVQIKKIAD
jgi:hypothetical protein